MLSRLLLAAMLILAISCSEKSKIHLIGGGEDLPPISKLTPEEEAQALEIYDDYTVMMAATSMSNESHIVSVHDDVRAIVSKKCVFNKSQAQNRNVVTTRIQAVNAFDETCPMEYSTSQVLTVQAGSQGQASGTGQTSSHFKVVGRDMASLTRIAQLDSTGTMTFSYLQKSQDEMQTSIGLSERGAMVYLGKVLETKMIVGADVIIKNGDTQSGNASVSIAAKTSFGWAVLRIDMIKRKDGTGSQTCYLNDRDITYTGRCSDNGSSGLPGMRAFNAMDIAIRSLPAQK